MSLRERLSIEFFRRRLAHVDALPQLVLIAIAVGLITGAVIISFRLAMDNLLLLLLDGDPENFEHLKPGRRVLYALGGATIVGLLMQWFSASERRVGVVHVMERLSLHQGYLPLRNALLQFVGGIIALVSGQSGGREGPAIHLGATSASALGQWFKLPNNSIRTLVACGTAAAIASSFNTPLAGVIFAMEVVMMEYSIASFLPVIVAAVSSTFLTQFFFGAQPAFSVQDANLNSLQELPLIALVGIATGLVAAAFIRLVQLFASLQHWTYMLRVIGAGAITAATAIVVPQVMGIGYDTVNSAMIGEMTVLTLAVIVTAKTLTSAAAVGLGMPVGLIGPTFVIGAALGGAMGLLGGAYSGQDVAVATYVIISMGAMMAAVLQAPLAALMAVMEMTANPAIIPPAMLAIVASTLIVSQLFGYKSMFISTLNTLGLEYPPSPVKLHMSKAGVAAIMNREFVRTSPTIDRAEALKLLEKAPSWIVVEDQEQVHSLLNGLDLRAFLEEREDIVDGIDLLRLPGERLDVISVESRATVQEAQEALSDSSAEACIVRRLTAPMIRPIIGVITPADIARYRKVIE